MGSTIKNLDRLLVCNHPVISNNLTIIRDKNTTSEVFRRAVKRIALYLIYCAVENLPTVVQKVETPLVECEATIIDPEAEVIAAPILRAGLIFSDIACEIIPYARIHHVGLYRDEKTLKPVSYYNNLPESFANPKNTYIYLLDPMLATGGSAFDAVNLFAQMNVPQENITFISLISAPEGINRLSSAFPGIRIVTACVDKCLNESGYILPGLGDAGDRMFSTIY